MLKSLLLISFLSAVCQLVWAEGSTDWHVTSGRNSQLQINGRHVGIDPKLRATLNNAEMVTVLPLALKDHHRTATMKWLLVRQASRSNGEAGYCGAGHEDRLILVRSFKSRAIIGDDFLLQSCLQSITMNIDQFEEMPAAIVVDDIAQSVSFRQIISNEHESFVQEVVMSVAHGHMKVLARKTLE